jgi:spore germination cell wall hydrolase CwlJ-like protein
MRTIIQLIVAVLALTVIAPGYANDTKVEVPGQSFFENRGFVKLHNDQPSITRQAYDSASEKIHTIVDTITTPLIQFDPKEFTCLARNIFFEAANEPEEGKVAVGLVTINRVNDGRFKNTICGVVDQKLSVDIPKTQIIEKKAAFLGNTTESKTVWSKLTICQFSWRCMFVNNPKSQDQRWLESQEIAKTLLADPSSYERWRTKYVRALYFHATGIRPPWANQKKPVEKIGGHIFYSEKI